MFGRFSQLMLKNSPYINATIANNRFKAGVMRADKIVEFRGLLRTEEINAFIYLCVEFSKFFQSNSIPLLSRSLMISFMSVSPSRKQPILSKSLLQVVNLPSNVPV